MDSATATEWITTRKTEAIITETRTPRLEGLALLRRCREEYPAMPVILVTAYGTIGDAVEAIRSGAFDYITKPFDEAELLRVVGNAVRTAAASDREVAAGAQADEWFGMGGRAPAWLDLRKVVEKASASPLSVLISGETGTGKELVA